MSNYVFNLTPSVTLPILNTHQRFPVRRIYCIGRNYAAHAIEMGSDPTRESPFFFLKPIEALQAMSYGDVHNHAYPTKTADYHFEAELVACLHKGGKDIPLESALDHVYGYAVGLDMTRRDLQLEAKKGGKPWEVGKSADHSAPIGPIHKASEVGHITSGEITLTTSGTVRQKATLQHMIWSVAEQVSILSTYFELFPGDLIFTGTPENVGAVKRGELMSCKIAGLGEIKMNVV